MRRSLPLSFPVVNVLRLTVEPFRDYDPEVLQVVPAIDGVNLSDLAREAATDVDPETTIEFGGIIPERFGYGPLVAYYLGQAASTYWQGGRIAVLGCECGEPGCQPVFAHVSVGRRSVQWSDFEPELGRAQDYRALGPFAFDLAQYLAEVEGAAAAIRT